MNNEGWEFEAMFVGRFQPFHNGHLNAVKGILNECKNVLIVVGSSQESGTKKNPYSSELRNEMIKESLIESGIDESRFMIVFLPDINDDTKWVQYLIDSVPKFKTVYTGSEETRKIFELYSGYDIKNVDFLDGLSGTGVRALIEKDASVKDVVPASVRKLI